MMQYSLERTPAISTLSNSFWTLDRLAAALCDRVNVAPPVGTDFIRDVSTDTRMIAAGDCFVALVGERYDAHEFLDRAVAAGASALVVQRSPTLRSLNVPIYVVDDTLVALGDLARYWRAAWGKPLIGIAGSNGKTSTKELVRAALGDVYALHATTGNLNNRIGVPLTLLSIPPEAECAVVEIGTSLPGEVAMLRDIARPDTAIITCIAEEHLEGLGDLNGVLREESAIFDGAEIAITPSTQPEIAAAAYGRAKQVIRAGLDDGDIHADSWSIDPDGKGRIIFDGVPVQPPMRGLHNLRNTMLALATAKIYGVDIKTAARGIDTMAVPTMRTEWQKIGRATILNDAYNANPGSARAAIEMLTASQASQRVVILGTMRELGPQTARYHDDVARMAISSSVDVIAGIGEFQDALHRVAPGDPRIVTAPDVDELWPLLTLRLLPDATILLKASRGVKLERILSNITKWATL
jgi:UDP-N-acetylmuramoyl-tripeptide--D-alanyl-D-alanine ligase